MSDLFALGVELERRRRKRLLHATGGKAAAQFAARSASAGVRGWARLTCAIGLPNK